MSPITKFLAIAALLCPSLAVVAPCSSGTCVEDETSLMQVQKTIIHGGERAENEAQPSDMDSPVAAAEAKIIMPAAQDQATYAANHHAAYEAEKASAADETYPLTNADADADGEAVAAGEDTEEADVLANDEGIPGEDIHANSLAQGQATVNTSLWKCDQYKCNNKRCQSSQYRTVTVRSQVRNKRNVQGELPELNGHGKKYRFAKLSGYHAEGRHPTVGVASNAWSSWKISTIPTKELSGEWKSLCGPENCCYETYQQSGHYFNFLRMRKTDVNEDERAVCNSCWDVTGTTISKRRPLFADGKRAKDWQK